MKAKIEIKMDNAAFDKLPGNELASILRDIANIIEDADFTEPHDRHFNVYDANGNHVGEFKIIGKAVTR